MPAKPLPDDLVVLRAILTGCETWLAVAVPIAIEISVICKGLTFDSEKRLVQADVDISAEQIDRLRDQFFRIPFPATARAFLVAPWDDDADMLTWLIEHSADAIGFVKIVSEAVASFQRLHAETLQKLTAEPPEHAMQRFCYDRWADGWTAKEIRSEVAKRPDWPQLPSGRNAPQRAAALHAKRRGLNQVEARKQTRQDR